MERPDKAGEALARWQELKQRLGDPHGSDAAEVYRAAAVFLELAENESVDLGNLGKETLAQLYEHAGKSPQDPSPHASEMYDEGDPQGN